MRFALMIPLGVIMFTEICQDPPQREFAEQNEPGKTFALDRTRSENAFRLGLRGGSRRHFTPRPARVSPEFSAELRIAVVEHVPMLAQTSGFLVNRIAGHLRHPLFGRVPRDAC